MDTFGGFVSVDLLPPAEKEHALRIRSEAGESGPLLGVLFGASPVSIAPSSPRGQETRVQEIRPVFLRGAQTYLLRNFCAPEQEEQAQGESLARYLGTLRSMQLSAAGPSHFFSEIRGTTLLRPYYEQLLGSGLEQAGSQELADKATLELITELAGAHAHGLVHGHIVPSNICMLGAGEFHCIDFGFHLFRNARLSQVYGGKEERDELFAQDVAELAGCLERAFQPFLGTEQRALLVAAQARNWKERPSISELARVFSLTHARRAQSSHSFSQQSGQGGGQGGGRGGGGVEVPAQRGRIINTIMNTQTSREQPSAVSTASSPSPEQDMSQTHNTDKSRNSSSSFPSSFSSSLPGRALLGAVLLLVLLRLGFWGYEYVRSPQPYARGLYTPAELDAFWSSGRATQISLVAQAAGVEGDRLAQDVILRSLENKEDMPAGVIAPLLRIALSGAWANDFSDQDRAFLFRIALASFIRADGSEKAALADRHPGVLYGLIAALPFSSQQAWQKNYRYSSLAQLPGPQGRALQGLARLRDQDFSESSARACVKILAHEFDESIVLACFADDTDIQVSQERLRVLLPPFAESTEDSLRLLTALQAPGTLLSDLADWFAEPSLAEWANAPAFLKLSWVAGLTEGLQHISFEQLADLLRFPHTALRQQAAKELLEAMPKSVTPQEIAFFVSGNVEWKRDQVITYLTLLDAKGEQREQLLELFLQSKPAVQSLGEVLSWRTKGYDLGVQTNIRLSDYLQKAQWSAPPIVLERFLKLDEPLFRAIAYSKLDVSNPAERALFNTYAQREPDAGLKVRVLEKLQAIPVDVRESEEKKKQAPPPVPELIRKKK